MERTRNSSILHIIAHGKNDVAEKSKILLDIDKKNNFVELSK